MASRQFSHSGSTIERIKQIGDFLERLAQSSPDEQHTIFQALSTADIGLKTTLESLLSPGERSSQPECLTRELWTQIEEIFFSALNYPSHQRSEILDEACAGNAFLRQKVELLLAADLEINE